VQGIETVIWDFNGTLMDDVDLAVRSMNALLQRRDLPAIDPDAHRRLFGHPVSGYYTALGFDLGRESLSAVSDEFHEEYLSGVAECELAPGAKELLEVFQRQGIRQFVLSAAEQTLLEAWVRILRIEGYIAGVYGLPDRLAVTKVTRGEELMKAAGVCPGTAILIGDTDHDLEVAAALGCSAVIVAQGHQSGDRLSRTGACIYSSCNDLRDGLRL